MEQSRYNNSDAEQQQLNPTDSESNSSSKSDSKSTTSTTEEQTKKKGAFPTWIDLLAILGIFLVGQFVAQVVISLMGFEVVSHEQISSVMMEVRRNLQFEMGRTTLFYSILAQPLVLLLVIIYRQIRGGKWRLGFSVRGFNPTILLWGFIMLLSTVVVIEPLMQYLPESQAPVGRGIYMLIALLIVAPIFEELLCRGVILEAIRRKHGGWIACVVSSLMFGVMHFEPQSILNAFMIGLLLGYLYIRTNSIFAPIIIHFLNNVMAYLYLVFGLSGTTLYSIIGNKTIYSVVYGISVGVVILSVVAISQQVIYLDRKKKGQNGGENNKIWV
ncbi:MAG: CPBP family intramembrane glutamic endopeptidase [Rikenellaceae bacterium]